jgi:UDPglucose 6-dehydrogenase
MGMKVAIIGSGYVGISTGVSLALIGHQVRLLDVNEAKIERLKKLEAPFFEPGLETALRCAAPNLEFTSDYALALAGVDVAIIAVGTPSLASGQADLGYLMDAVHHIAPHLTRNGPVLVVKSTVPVGTNRRMLEALRTRAPGMRVALVSNPEFLRQGRALSDTLYPERIVLGGDDTNALDVMKALYRPILNQDFVPPPGLPRPANLKPVGLHRIGLESAELAKYAANAFLATKISFVNEIANVCDAVEADIDEIVSVLGGDARIGPHFLHAGLGYGGSCFPKDTQALAAISRRNGYSFKLLSAVIEVNNAQRYRAIEKLEQALGSLAGYTVAILGLAFKPGTDDLRDAPSLEIIHELEARGVHVRAHDPVAMNAARAVLGPAVILCSSAEDAIRGADAVVLVTEWPEYLTLPWIRLKTLMRQPVVVDGRNALGDLKALGFGYFSIGRTHKPHVPVEAKRRVAAAGPVALATAP